MTFLAVFSADFIANKFKQEKCSCEVECKVVSITDANAIDKEVWLYKPTHVIIHALWVTPDKMEELAQKWKDVLWVVRVHSKIPFLANEGIAFSWLCQYKDIAHYRSNFKISGNSRSFGDDLANTMNMHVLYLPNIYCPNKKDGEAITGKNPSYLDIGCFGALRPMKNQMNQAVAAVKFADKLGKPLRFHINGARIEQNGDQVLKNLRAFFGCVAGHSLVEHPWVDHNKFVEVVKTMDLGMQVSFSESFNIVSADFIWNGVPMVTSPDIDWSPPLFAADPNDTNDMVCKLLWAWYGKIVGLQKLSKRALMKYNEEAFEIWANFVCSTGKDY